ncbi:MAG: TonB-dependent receptor [Alphaproteobacteria bacterium]|nr:TonB-dependent receptor [Alphaproteobacteria bacterium]
MSNRLQGFRRVLLAASALGLSATAVHAEAIETVVVTVERHAEDVQDVPESVATLSGDALGSIFQSGQDVRALAGRVPSLYAESSNGRVAPRFYIRGLGNTDFDLAASQPVSIIEDDVVLENVVLKSAPLFDIAAVEVDRGPQGTLFGRNTTAGIVKFTTTKPSETFDAYGTVSYGELGTMNAEGAIGGRLGAGISARVSVLWQHRDDYIDNAHLGLNGVLGGYDERAARVQLAFQPIENLNVLVNVHARSLEGTAAIFRANILTKGSNKLNANYIKDKVFFDQGFAVPTDENPQAYDGMGGSLKVAYDFPAGIELTSITAYESTHGFSRGDIDGGFGAVFLPTMGPGFIPFPSDTQDGLAYLHQFTQEIHLASTDTANPLFWQVGAFYFDTSYNDTTNPFFVPATTVHQANTSVALFGQARYRLTDQFSVTAGVRWTNDIKGLTANGPLIVPITTPVKARGSNVSWDISALYALSDNVNLYARVATGFRAPSIQGRDLAFGGSPSIARSETVTSYEGGIKTLLAGNTLRLNVGGFGYHVNNMQLTAIGGVGNTIRLINARGGDAYGFEADAQWVPNDNWEFTAGFSYNHTEISDPVLTTVPCGGGPGTPLASLMCTPLDPYTQATGRVALNGNPFPQAPEYIANVSAKYTMPLASGAEIYAYTDWYIQGYTNFFLYESREFNSNGNYEGGLKVGYIFPDKVWEVALYGRNITDAKNLQGGIDFNNLTGFVGDPRVVGIQLSAHIQ